MAGILWKPASERNGNLVVLFPEDPGTVVIKDANTGEVIATGNNTGASNDFGATVRFDKPGSAFSNVVVETGSGESFFIDSGGSRRENIDLSPSGTTPTAPTGIGSAPGGEGEAGAAGIAGVAPPRFIDPGAIQPFPVNFQAIPQAGFNFTDPVELTAEVGEFNRAQSAQAFETGLARAKRIQQEELASIVEFAQGISDFQQGLIAGENVFNQQQKIQAAEAGIPGIQGTLERQRGRAETLAGGRLLSDAEDRAFELAARSASADGTFVRGFGDESVVGKRQSEILSAQQRLGLTQIGEGFLTRSIQQAAGLLVDEPLKANISQRLPAQPNVPLASITGQQQAAETALTTISPGQALQSTVQQEQFQTNVEQRTNEFNATMDLNAQQFNSSQFFQALQQQIGLELFNQTEIQNAIQGQINAQAEAAREAEEIQRFNELLSQYRDNLDKQQFVDGLASIFGALSRVPKSLIDSLVDVGGGLFDFVQDQLGFGEESTVPPAGEPVGSAPTPSGGAGTIDSEGEVTPVPETTTPPTGEPVGSAEGPNGEPGTIDSEGNFTPDSDRLVVLNVDESTGAVNVRFVDVLGVEGLNNDPLFQEFSTPVSFQLPRSQLTEFRGLI